MCSLVTDPWILPNYWSTTILSFDYSSVSIENVEALIQVLDHVFYAANIAAVKIGVHGLVGEEYILLYGFRDYFINKLSWFLSRVERLQLAAKGDHEVKDAGALFHFHGYMDVTNRG